ncbi:MAG: hypothetical protein JXR97_08020 [Planctomycetes bacterium]|nr:hypothetical protein [Planctomycetota bacterium]
MMKILHLPTSVGNHAYSLSRGERAWGHDSDLLVARSGKYAYPADIELQLEGKPFIGQLLALYKAFCSVRKKYDVYHFNFGRSLFTHRLLSWFPHIDLPFYGEGRPLFVTYNGCDARMAAETRRRRKFSACHPNQCTYGPCQAEREDHIKQAAIQKMALYVEHMWAVNPDLLRYLPPEKASFLPYAVDMEALPVRSPSFDCSSLRVLHAPTNRGIKGTDFVLAAAEKVADKPDCRMELILVEGLTHQQALARYAEADLVVDQLLVGWYGGLAVEVMAMGKPVITYLHEDDLSYLPVAFREQAREALILATPETLPNVLERCCQDRAWLRERSEAAVAFARHWHNPKFVAETVIAKYADALACHRKV